MRHQSYQAIGFRIDSTHHRNLPQHVTAVKLSPPSLTHALGRGATAGRVTASLVLLAAMIAMHERDSLFDPNIAHQKRRLR